LRHIVNGINLDDLGDHRPGIGAAREAHVLSPLCEAGFTKQDVRDLSRKLNLPTWAKPAMACLSSRVPYGQEITEKKLAMIEQAEDVLLSMGFKGLRVRHHGDIARIELNQQDIARFFADGKAESVQTRFKEIGFTYAAVDIIGYQPGRLNEKLDRNLKGRPSNHV
ncbi:MAG: TIGR00268 family protein, partial [Nitrospinae bacterium]|nr:TIGR00268 family protein [Nitrospinota bacterium]